MPCFDDMDLENLDSCTNADIPSGISEVGVHHAVHSQATTIPMPLKVGDVGYTYAKSVEVSADIVFAAGKGFAKMNVQVDTGEVKIETVGEKGNKKQKQSFEFMVPGSDAKTLGWARTHINTPSIFLVKERGGNIRQLGDANNPAYLIEGSHTTGKTGEDNRGYSFTIETWGVPIIYTGDIQAFVATP